MYTSNKISLKNKSLSDIFFLFIKLHKCCKKKEHSVLCNEGFGQSVSGSGIIRFRFW